jgi:hypothetical protein
MKFKSITVALAATMSTAGTSMAAQSWAKDYAQSVHTQAKNQYTSRTILAQRLSARSSALVKAKWSSLKECKQNVQSWHQKSIAKQ